MIKRRLYCFAIVIIGVSMMAGCKQTGENNQKNKEDKKTIIEVNKKDIQGVWLRLRPMSNPEVYEGFNLKEEGTMDYENIFNMIGQSWDLDGNILILNTKTDKIDQPRSSRFVIQSLDKHLLSVYPENGSEKNLRVYKRSEVSLMHTAPEGTLDAYIYFINKADAVGVQTLMVQNRSFSIKAPMDVTEYNILSKKKLTEQEAAAISIKPDIREGDIQLEVEQVIQDSKRMNYTYWLRQREGFWGLLIWSYKKSA